MAGYLTTPEAVIAAVEKHRAETDALRRRMDSDYSLYRLDTHVIHDALGNEMDGFAVYTSNAPKVFAKKIMAWVSQAQMVLRIPHMEATRADRTVDDLKERFLIGLLRAADERLLGQMAPVLRDQLAFQVCLRGWYAGRAMFVKLADGSTVVDITPFDPRNTYWRQGAGGLLWACHVTYRQRDVLEEEYETVLANPQGADGAANVPVYDCYDRESNAVAAGGVWLKPPTPHGSTSVPVFLGPVGPVPFVSTEDGQGTIADYGESLYEDDRGLFAQHNEAMSIMLEMVARSRDQSLLITSQDGKKTLSDNPYLRSTEIGLTPEESVKPLGLLDMAKETGPFMALVSGEMQRGSLPFSMYGELPFQLSGFAINTLRAGVESVVRHRLAAVEAAYRRICSLLSDAYATQRFQGLRLSGWGNDQKFFDMEFAPQAIAQGGTPEITLVPVLPQDDTARFAQAQIAREGAVPLMPDFWIRDEVLKVQNADNMDDAIKEQLAERLLPEAGLYSLMLGAVRRGRTDLAQLYKVELMRLMMMKMGGMPSVEGPMGMVGQNGGGPPGAMPQAMPNAMMGVPPPVPTPQAGPNVPPGSPRPGAVTPEARLARMGLVGPGG